MAGNDARLRGEGHEAQKCSDRGANEEEDPCHAEPVRELGLAVRRLIERTGGHGATMASPPTLANRRWHCRGGEWPCMREHQASRTTVDYATSSALGNKTLFSL